MGNDKKIRKGPNKIFALITYVLAFACLVLGLCLPFGNLIGAEGTDAMLVMQLPAAVDSVVYPWLEINLAETFGTPAFTYSFRILAGWFGEDAAGIDLGAIAALLYALITVLGLFALVAAIINVASKKSRKNIALRAASFIEAFALVPLTVLVAIQLTLAPYIALGLGYQWSWALLAAFGGVALLLVVQAIFYKKGSGVIKFILALLSGLTLFVAVFDITVFLPSLADTLSSFGLGLNLFTGTPALTPVLGLFLGNLVWAQDTMLWAVAYIAAMALGLLLFVNFVLDAIGLGKRTKRFMLISNVVRYALEVIAVALVIIMAFITDGVEAGLYSYVIAVLAVVALVINIIRLVAYKPARAKAKSGQEANGAVVVAETEGESKKDRKRREKEEAKAQKEAEKAAKAQKKGAVADETVAAAEPVAVYTEDKEGNVVYKPIIYDGPTDDFIRLLNNEQKLEFSRVFLERSANPLSCIPQYNVGGKNDKFFSSVFIYYGKVRDLISDGLMNEIYKQVNLMH